MQCRSRITGKISRPPPKGRIELTLPTSLRGANIAGLRLEWRDDEGVMQSATLPVHVESKEHLLPPMEFRSACRPGSITSIVSSLAASPAEWVEALGRRAGGWPRNGGSAGISDSLRAVDAERLRSLSHATVSYGSRRSGGAPARLGPCRERRRRHVLSAAAGPARPANACRKRSVRARTAEDAAKKNETCTDSRAVLLFSLAEIELRARTRGSAG